MPLRRFVLSLAEHHPNLVVLLVLGILLFDTTAGTWALKANRDQTDQLRHVVATQKADRVRADKKLCESVRQGKLDRISEYRFTISRTRAFYEQNPSVPKANLKLTVDFYDALIARTRASIIECR